MHDMNDNGAVEYLIAFTAQWSVDSTLELVADLAEKLGWRPDRARNFGMSSRARVCVRACVCAGMFGHARMCARARACVCVCVCVCAREKVHNDACDIGRVPRGADIVG